MARRSSRAVCRSECYSAKAELAAVADNAGMATFYHVTPTANRESIGQHGLDWYHGGGGIAGSLIPEQQGVFLARDMHEAHFFVRMGSRRFAALDIWEVTLEDEPSGDLEDPDELGREFDGYFCCMRAIPPAQLRLVERDIPGDPDPGMPDLRPISQIEEDLRAEGWADHTSLAMQLTLWDRLGHGVASYSMTVDDYTNDLCSRDYLEIAIGRLPSYLSGCFRIESQPPTKRSATAQRTMETACWPDTFGSIRTPVGGGDAFRPLDRWSSISPPRGDPSSQPSRSPIGSVFCQSIHDA